jgi:hypothetical protein
VTPPTRGAVVRWLPSCVAVLSVAVLAVAAAVGWTTSAHLRVQRLGVTDTGWWTCYLVFVVVGAIVATRRPDNRVGWLLLAAGGFNAFAQGVLQYAVWGLARHPGSLPAADVAAWVSSFLWSPAVAILVVMLAYFPSGQLASPRWRWLPWTASCCATVMVVVTAVDFWPRRGARLLTVGNSYESHTVAGQVVGVLWPFIPICAIGSMVSVVLRYRRARGVERQQLKWLVLAALISGPCIILGERLSQHSRAWTVVQLLNSPALAAVAIALAVLRYRLYDIDRIVSRTVSYLVVTGFVVAVYIGCVALAGAVLGSSSSSVTVAAATLLAAAAFQPLRRRVQRGVDRRFDRAAYDARLVVDAFTTRLRDQVDVDTVRADLEGTVSIVVAPTQVSIWLATP